MSKPKRRPRPTIPARRLARELAMKVFFEMDLTDRNPADLLERYRSDGSLDRLDRRYAERLVEAVGAGLDAIDEQIGIAAPAFPVDQIATVDRNILRVAVCELGSDFSVPPKVVINEAIEIAKDYGGDASSRFVNGVLGAIIDSRKPDGSE